MNTFLCIPIQSKGVLHSYTPNQIHGRTNSFLAVHSLLSLHHLTVCRRLASLGLRLSCIPHIPSQCQMNRDSSNSELLLSRWLVVRLEDGSQLGDVCDLRGSVQADH